MRQLLLHILAIAFLVFNFACVNDTSDQSTKGIRLSAEDIGVTQVWLRVGFTESIGPRSLVLTRNGKTILDVLNLLSDTLVVDDSLQPNHPYLYRATGSFTLFGIPETSSISLTTLDTTSHNFTWQVDTLGDGANSLLKDVAIVNDSCVFAVGEIHIKDSLGNWDPALYNVARWNGSKWSYSVGASVTINAVFAFSDSDVWAGTTAPYHFDGATWRGYNVTGLFNGYVTKIWGTSGSNIYMVGTNGAIMHFNGSVWQKMESGTDVDLLDVWGSPDGSVVWACGFYSSKRGTYLLRYTHESSKWELAYDGSLSETVILNDSLSGAYSSLYAPTTHRLFIVSDAGLYETAAETRGAAQRIPFPFTWSGFPWRLRGTAANALFVAGEYFMLGHFNGVTFNHYSDLSGYGRLMSVDQHDKLVVAVGYMFDPINSKGLVFRGTR